MTQPSDMELAEGPTMLSGVTHAPMEAHWATFVEYMRANGVDIEALGAEIEAFARKRRRRLAMLSATRARGGQA